MMEFVDIEASGEKLCDWVGFIHEGILGNPQASLAGAIAPDIAPVAAMSTVLAGSCEPPLCMSTQIAPIPKPMNNALSS